jgi:hypothetical protein
MASRLLSAFSCFLWRLTIDRTQTFDLRQTIWRKKGVHCKDLLLQRSLFALSGVVALRNTTLVTVFCSGRHSLVVVLASFAHQSSAFAGQ